MPTYEYKCENCGVLESAVRSMTQSGDGPVPDSDCEENEGFGRAHVWNSVFSPPIGIHIV